MEPLLLLTFINDLRNGLESMAKFLQVKHLYDHRHDPVLSASQLDNDLECKTLYLLLQYCL